MGLNSAEEEGLERLEMVEKQWSIYLCFFSLFFLRFMVTVMN